MYLVPHSSAEFSIVGADGEMAGDNNNLGMEVPVDRCRRGKKKKPCHLGLSVCSVNEVIYKSFSHLAAGFSEMANQ